MFNKVVLVGNLTRDIELRYLQNGSAVGKSAIAVTRKYNSNGEKKEETCFIDIDFWGKTAEIANQYLHKGSKVLIEGRLKLDQWQDQNGQNRSKHSIYVESMEMLGTPQNSQNSGNFGNQNSNFGGGNFNSQNNFNGYGSNQGYNGHNSNNNQNFNQNHNSGSNFGYSNQNNNKTNFSNNTSQKDDVQEEKIPDIDVNADMDEELPF